MLGAGWFPDTLGGLERYYRALFEQLGEASGVVVGPAALAPGRLRAVSGQDSALALRLLSFWRAARSSSAGAEVIDAHFALYAAAPLLLGRASGTKLVFHFHGPWADESLASADSSRARFALRRRLERRVLSRADAHVVLSSAFRRILLERYRVSPWEVHSWAPGVELDAFTPGDRALAREGLALERGAFIVACVRRLVPRMGIGDLLDVWETLGGELPAGSTLLLVGDGPLAPELAARASSPALTGRVRLLGRVSEHDLLDVYRAADVAVVPTRAVEGFGMVVLEAAACGTPSIVTDVGGLREATAPLDPSLVVAGGDPAALGERLKAAARGALPTRERTRSYAEGFSWPLLAERHRRLYRRLAVGRRERRLRVVYLDHVARLSGGEIAMLRLLPHLENVQAHVILAEDGLLADRLASAGISVEVLALDDSVRELRRDAVRLGGAPPAVALQTLAYAARTARRLRQLQPDLVHTNSLKSGLYGSLAARLARVPLVWHLRDRLAEDYIPRSAVWLMRAQIGAMADAVIVNSPATLETLSARARRRSRVLPDSAAAPAAGRAREDGPATFGMLGRIAPWKGQDLFLRAFAAAFPGGSERAVLVGEPMFGEHAYERELHELTDQLGLAARTDFRGFREDVWGELAALDVLVHASVIPEPFGQVVLEGMAAGLAVIAPDEGGPAGLITDGETGLLFRSRDRDALAASMKSLAGDPAERRRLGEHARGAAQAYHPGALAQRLERVYEDVLAGEAAAGAGEAGG